MRHEFSKIEPKWQKRWAEQNAFAAQDNSDKKKFYNKLELLINSLLDADYEIVPVSEL